MKLLIVVIILLLATGIISFSNGTFHFSKPAATTAYDNVKSSASQAAQTVEQKKQHLIDKNSTLMQSSKSIIIH